MLCSMRRYHLPLLAVLLTLTACEERTLEGPPPADHGEAPSAEEDPLGARIHAFAYERAAVYEPEAGTLFRGSLRQGQVEDYPVTLLGTRCYVAVAVGAESIESLDMTMVDPNGSPLLRDEDEGNEVVLGLRNSLCPAVPGVYRIRIRVSDGSGDFVVRLYGHDIV